MSRPHVVVITRWRENYALYERYLDHQELRVSYVATEVALGSVPKAAVDTWLVAATDDLEAVRQGVSVLAARHGPPSAIVALKEDDLLVGAVLREIWGCPGPTYRDLIVYRDKYLMTRAVAAAGLPTQPFALVFEPADVCDFAASHGWPVMVKPRMSSASEGVIRLGGPSDTAGLRVPAGGLVAQAYNPWPVYHVDGLYGTRGLVRWRAARYFNSCLEFRAGAFLGSAEVDDPVLNGKLGAATEQFLRALRLQPTVFHLEAFVSDRGEIVFLEVGARVGGGETALLWREVHGYDLMEQACRIQLGQPADERPDGCFPAEFAGHLLIPAPVARPCRITSVTGLAVGQAAAGPYAAVVPRVGEVIPAAESFYEHVGGRFRFRGRSSREVTDGIFAIATGFRITAEPLPDAGEADTGAVGHHFRSR